MFSLSFLLLHIKEVGNRYESKRERERERSNTLFLEKLRKKWRYIDYYSKVIAAATAIIYLFQQQREKKRERESLINIEESKINKDLW